MVRPEKLLEKYNIGATCVAVIGESDTAKNWNALFRAWDKEKEKEVTRRERSVSMLDLCNHAMN